MNQQQKLKSTINLYAKALEYRGFFKFYESNSIKQGYQVLMAEGNSGVIFSIEVDPSTNKVEIRSDVTQRNGEFYTIDILERLQSKYPLFSDFMVATLEDLPLISLAEEEQLPFIMPLQSRISLYVPNVKLKNNQIHFSQNLPAHLKSRLTEISNQYYADISIANTKASEIRESKILNLPKQFIEFYPVNSEIYEYDEKGNSKKMFFA